jgi:hypothetical protein
MDRLIGIIDRELCKPAYGNNLFLKLTLRGDRFPPVPRLYHGS